MSLVDEALVNLLNRRFVCTYYNASGKIGADANGMEFVSRLGGNPKYGCIATSDGEMLASFGYGRHEVFLAFQYVLRAFPEHDKATEKESDIKRKAAENPLDFKSQMELAKLFRELMQFDKAQEVYTRLTESSSLSQAQKNQAWYESGHTHLINLNKPAKKDVLEAFTQIEDPSDDIQANVVLDKMQLDVVQKKGTFFGGWVLADPKLAEPYLQQLEKLKLGEKHGRLGQALLYKGICHSTLGKSGLADAIWKEHFSTFPEDRWAMISRILNSEYRFSPNSSKLAVGGTSVGLDAQIDAARPFAKKLRALGYEVTLPETDPKHRPNENSSQEDRLVQLPADPVIREIVLRGFQAKDPDAISYLTGKLTEKQRKKFIDKWRK